MSDRTALLRAIIENPDDDARRLVFADWLDDHGEAELAEFIRIQCELAGTSMPEDRRLSLIVRANRLDDQLDIHLEPELPGIWYESSYRGFPCQVMADRWDDLRAAWDKTFSKIPITWVTVAEMSLTGLDEFLSLPETRTLQHVFLRFDSPLDRVVDRLTRSEATDRWYVLELLAGPENVLTDRGAAVLVDGKHLRGLGGFNTGLDAVTPRWRTALRRRFGGTES